MGARYNVNEDNTIKVDVVWAGDSRAYAFIPKFGLKQLTTDDEDSSGAIDNLFCIKMESHLGLIYTIIHIYYPQKSNICLQ